MRPSSWPWHRFLVSSLGCNCRALLFCADVLQCAPLCCGNDDDCCRMPGAGAGVGAVAVAGQQQWQLWPEAWALEAFDLLVCHHASSLSAGSSWLAGMCNIFIIIILCCRRQQPQRLSTAPFHLLFPCSCELFSLFFLPFCSLMARCNRRIYALLNFCL